MRPHRTHNTNVIHRLKGGTEDSDLWAYYAIDENDKLIICSVWVPNEIERKEIAEGKNILLMVWGLQTPPVTMCLTDEELGKKPEPL